VQQRPVESWLTSLARASLAWVFYVVPAAFTLVSAWGVGAPALILFVLIIILGPFVAGGVACRIVPAARPLEIIMGAGILFGLFFFLIVGAAAFKFAATRHPGSSNPVYILVALFVVGPLLGALAFSRLKLRNPD
jgi:hypothetical protein